MAKKKVATNGWLTIYSLTCPTLLYYQAHAICPWQCLNTQHRCRPKNRGWIDGWRKGGRELGNWVSALLDVEVWIKSIFYKKPFLGSFHSKVHKSSFKVSLCSLPSTEIVPAENAATHKHSRTLSWKTRIKGLTPQINLHACTQTHTPTETLIKNRGHSIQAS